MVKRNEDPNKIKVKDLGEVFENIYKKTGKRPHLKGKGSGGVKLGFD